MLDRASLDSLRNRCNEVESRVQHTHESTCYVRGSVTVGTSGEFERPGEAYQSLACIYACPECRSRLLVQLSQDVGQGIDS